MIFSIINDPEIPADELNHDLVVINQWAYKWKMKFNHDPKKKAGQLLFTSKKTTPTPNPSLSFNVNIVPKVEEQKPLGLFLDSKLSVERHLNDKFVKAKKGIEIIKYLSKGLERNFRTGSGV